MRIGTLSPGASHRVEAFAVFLNNERAMQAQQGCGRLGDGQRIVPDDRDPSQWNPIIGQGPGENRGQDRSRRHCDGRRPGKHLRVVLAAGAIVLVVVIGAARHAAVVMRVVATTRGWVGWMVRVVIGRARFGVVVSNGNDGPRLGVRTAGGVRSEQSVEVAATERNRDHQKEGDQNPEWIASCSHPHYEASGLKGDKQCGRDSLDVMDSGGFPLHVTVESAGSAVVKARKIRPIAHSKKHPGSEGSRGQCEKQLPPLRAQWNRSEPSRSRLQKAGREECTDAQAAHAAMDRVPCGGSPLGGGSAGRLPDHACRSKRSRFMTFVHAATKSVTNADCESPHA